MPVRQAQDFLGDALDSLQDQSLDSWELLAVPDRADAASEKILADRTRQDARIRILKHPSAGILPALETALQQARGNFLGRADADDWYPPQRLEQMKKALEESPARTVVTGQVRYFPRETLTPGYQRYEQWINEINRNGLHALQAYRECPIASPNWLMRRQVLEEIGGFSGLSYPEDYDLFFRWYAWGLSIRSLPEVSLHWREHPERSSRNSPHYKQKAFFRLKIRRFLEIDFRSDRRLYVLGTGQKGKLAGRYLWEAGVDFEWLGLFPENYPQGLWGKPVAPVSKVPAAGQSQVLVAVYPGAEDRQKLEALLQEQHFREGQDFWYL